MAELAMFLPTDGENVKEALATHKKPSKKNCICGQKYLLLILMQTSQFTVTDYTGAMSCSFKMYTYPVYFPGFF